MRLPLEMRQYTSLSSIAFRDKARWRDSDPFVENTRGLLIHRPRRVTLHTGCGYPHIAVHYYCGNSANGTAKNMSFLSEPPDDALLCEVCEARAVMCGLPSAAAIVGRHVHIGKLKAVRTCCKQVHP